VSGYTEDTNVKGIMVFPYSAVFSAFGAAAADYEHSYHRAVTFIAPPFADGETKVKLGKDITEAWKEMEEEAYAIMEREGYSKDKVSLKHLAMVRYARQLNDMIVESPVPRLVTPKDWDKLIGEFEEMYEKMYTTAAKYPEAGYEIFELGLVATVEKTKPVLRKYPLEGQTPPEDAFKGKRDCYFKQGWIETPIYEWDRLKAGNLIKGPVMIEHPTTVVVVPPEQSFYVDEYLTGWLK